MDPSLENNFRVIYNKEIPMEIRLVETETPETGSQEVINAKLLVQGEVQNPQMVKIELTSEADLFFHYSKIETIESFQQLKQDQQLTLEFEGFIGLLIKLLNSI